MSQRAVVRSKSRKQNEKVAVSSPGLSRPTTQAIWELSGPLIRFAPIAVFLVVFVSYLPTLWNDFVHWQGMSNFIENPDYRGIDWALLQWLLVSTEVRPYQPLNWLSFAADTLYWGSDPFGYHLTSLLLHSANAVLLFYLAHWLFGRVGALRLAHGYSLPLGASIAALFFALHPLRVESVAWISARGDLLSGFCLLMTVFCYFAAINAHDPTQVRWRWMVASWISYTFSLFSSQASLALPIGLLILDFFSLRRLPVSLNKFAGEALRTVVYEKGPYVATAIVASILGVFTSSQGGFQQMDGFAKAALFSYSALDYLIQIFLPLSVSPVNDFPVPFQVSDWIYAGGITVVLGCSIVAWLWRHRWPAVCAAWWWYVVMLAPLFVMPRDVEKIFPGRDTYVAGLSWALMVGAGAVWCHAALSGKLVKSLLAFGSGVIGPTMLGMLVWNQVQMWHTAEILLRSAVRSKPESRNARKHLANILATQGREEDVLEVYTEAVRRSPRSAAAHVDLGRELAKRAKWEAALNSYRQALELDSTFGEAHVGIGVVLMRDGDHDQAAKHFRAALDNQIALIDAHLNLGNILVARGNLHEAARHYHAAVRVDPSNANAYFNLGNVYAIQGDTKRAIDSYRLAVRVNPQHADARFRLANLLVRNKNLEEARRQYEETVKIDPEFAEAYHNLGRVLAAQGDLASAAEQFYAALAARSDFAEAHLSLSQALAEMGRVEEARKHHLEAVRLMNRLPPPPGTAR